MAERENATLTLNSTVPPATVATAPAARITPTAPTARGAGRISSASGARRPVPRATAARSVSDGRRLQPDGVGGRGGGRGEHFLHYLQIIKLPPGPLCRFSVEMRTLLQYVNDSGSACAPPSTLLNHVGGTFR